MPNSVRHMVRLRQHLLLKEGKLKRAKVVELHPVCTTVRHVLPMSTDVAASPKVYLYF